MKKMMNFDPQTRLIDLTVGDLMELLSSQNAPRTEAEPRQKVYGIAGIASIFNCSIATANRIKKSGRIDQAIMQNGRIIVVDAELALQLYNNNK